MRISLHQTRTTLLLSFCLITGWLKPPTAHALRAPDMSGDDSGAIAVYTFDESGGDTVQDTAAGVTPLHLRLSTIGNLPTSDGTTIRTNAVFQNGYLLMNPKPNGIDSNMADQGYQSAQRHRTLLISDGAASKLSSCTSGFTIQAFVRPWFPFHGSQSGNMIVGLSNSEGLTTVAKPNFALYQSGQAGAEAALLEVRTGTSTSATQASAPGAFSSVREGENLGRVTEIIATQEPSGILTVYVNRIARSSLAKATPVFLPNAKLVIGNELIPLSLQANGTINVNQQRNWSGEIYHIAIYCRGFTRSEILGAIVENKSRAEVVRPLNTEITRWRQEARRLAERLTGVIFPIDHPMLLKMEQRLQQRDRLGAAKIITGDATLGEPGHPDFLNTVVKQFALKMSNREETIRAPLNDFTAAFIGVTRDDRSAQELLTADFFYMADPTKAKVRSDIFKDILVSNNHYEDLEAGRWDLGKVLMRVPGPDVPTGYPNGQQIALDATGTYTPNPDPAGVLTSRAFMSAHAIAGTNRRMVDYAFREFMCLPISEMADTSASPARIGRDVDRWPGGDATKFETSCKGCHTVMDGFRGAFSKFDFANITVGNTPYSFIRNTQVSRIAAFGFSAQQVDSHGTVRKMNHNENVFPDGYVIVDDSFINNAIGVANRTTFGWSGPNKLGGVGVGQFGRLLADSNRFAKCMAKRVFDTVCTPGENKGSEMTPVIDVFATKFKDSGYKLKTLFQEVASHNLCAQSMGR